MNNPLPRTFLSWVVCLFASVAFAQDFSPIRFEFEGPDVPAEWNSGFWAGGTREIQDGSYVITAPPNFGGASSDYRFEHTNLAIETQVRFLAGGVREDFASILLRSTDGVADGYFGSVSSNGELLLSRSTATSNVDPSLEVRANGYDAVDQDLNLRLVANGASLDLFAWPASAPMPSAPSLSLVDPDNRYSSGNEISLVSSSFQTGTSWPVAFRYVEIAPVPEPHSGTMAIFGLMFVAMLRTRRRCGNFAYFRSGVPN